jgi:D-threo-aldose 1-dehydrogenase
MDSGMRALELLKSGGAISAFGLGVNEVQVCLDVMARAPIDCILLAGRYTLLDRDATRELLPHCTKSRTSLIIGGVFNSGILATGPVPGAHFDYGPADEDVVRRVTRMEKIAGEQGIPLAAAALQFPLRDPNVSTVLIGTAKPGSLERNLANLSVEVPEKAWTDFDSVAMNK